MELCQALLTHLKNFSKRRAPYPPTVSAINDESIMRDLRNQLMRYAKEIERHSEEPPTALNRILHEAEEAIILFHKEHPFRSDWPSNYVRNMFLGQAVEAGLCSFLSYRLSTENGLIHDEAKPLLAWALDSVRAELPEWERKQMVELLLLHGADPNEMMVIGRQRRNSCDKARITIWSSYLRYIADSRCRDPGSIFIYDILKLLIEHGADPKQRIYMRTESGRAPKTVDRPDLSVTEISEDIYEEAGSLICSGLGDELATHLFKKVGKNQKTSKNPMWLRLVERISWALSKGNYRSQKVASA
ncbi:MAG: hypothetical protein Q9165_005800 [Trypethelium subeluteriae]